MTDFRVLCAELTDELSGYASANPHHDSDALVIRARAALVAEPAPPAEGEVAELVTALRGEAVNCTCTTLTNGDLRRAADLLERQAALAEKVWDLVSTSHGVAGLHLNGDLAPWEELLPGGRFEYLPSLPLPSGEVE